MISQTLAIARNTFVESARQPIYFVVIAISALLQVFNNLLSTYSMGYTDTSEVSGDDKLLLDIGLATVLVCATLLAALVATAVISREIEQKTALTVISKPIGRPLFIVGKFLGASGAVLAATGAMLLIFLLALEHGVMSRAYDEVDQPVLVFSVAVIALSVGLAAWGNFFYGWVFSSTAFYVALPALALAYLGALALGTGWELQGFAEDFKPQVLIACAAVGMAMLVLTAVAVAASTRLGQVMTIVVCLGVFVFGLLSNYFLGRHAYQNDYVARITSAEVVNDRDGDLREPADTWRITLKSEPRVNLGVTDSVYYAADPTGIRMAVPAHGPFEGSLGRLADVETLDPENGSLVIGQMDDRTTLVIVNARGLAVARPPREGDYLFAEPTVTNLPARVAWSIAPNMQFFWLVDAVTQNHPVPLRYVLTLAGYCLMHTAALLSLAVILFQKRDVG